MKRFYDYFKNLREKEHFSLEQVCEGICTHQTVSLLEKEGQETDKLIQNTLIERLGVGAEDYENLLNYKEYDRWEARQKILHSITFEEWERAEHLLNQYRKIYCQNINKKNGKKRNFNHNVKPGVNQNQDMEENSTLSAVGKLEEQFCLSMQGQIDRHKGAAREKLRDIFRQAVNLTVPELEKGSLGARVLSLQELNLILELEQYRDGGERLERYQEVVDYIDNRKFDETARAKVYPKAVYFLCRCIINKRGDLLSDQADNFRYRENTGNPSEPSEGKRYKWTDAKLLRYCNKALHILRNAQRIYFLWEILVLRESILHIMINKKVSDGKKKGVEAWKSMLMDNVELREALEEVYVEFQVPKETFDYSYLYVMKEVYCINDIISIRRRMLKMRAADLCNGICDEKTLRRLEGRKTVSRKWIVESLLERLKLPPEFTRTEILTDNSEARKLMSQLRVSINHGQIQEADKLLKKLEEKLSNETIWNRQVMENEKAIIAWKLGKISREEYLEAVKKALEITLPYEIFLEEGLKYLTNEEMTCIQNMMAAMDVGEKDYMTCIRHFEEMYQPYIENELQEAVSGMYEYIMGHVASEYGNRGEFARSEEIENIILRGCLRFRRSASINLCLYGRWWNYNEKKKNGIPIKHKFNDVIELNKCIIFGRYNRNKRSEQFYYNKFISIQIKE